MIGSDIATRVKRAFGDESSAQIQDADIIRWINDALREIAWSNDILQVRATAATVSNQAEYTLPTNVLRLRSVKYQGLPLKGISLQEADSILGNYDDPLNVPTGIPTTFWVFAQSLRLYPTPATGGGADLTLYYTRTPNDLVTLADTPDIPVQYHNRIVEYCLTQAYELDDNYNAAQIKASQFQNGLERSRGEADFVPQDFYPGITSLPGDYGDYVDCM